MPTIITGARDTSTVNAEQRVIDMSKQLHRLEPDKAPLLVLVSKLDKKVAVNPTFNVLEKYALPKWDAINYGAGYGAGDAALVIDNNSYFRAGDIVKVPRTGETMLVTSLTSTTTINVTRSWGTVAAAALVDNDPLFIIGSVSAENATSRILKMTKAVTVTNNTQIFRMPFGASRTDQNSEMYTGKSREELRFDAALDHMKEIETSFWFGEKATSGTTRTTGGVFEFITTNVTPIDGNLTEPEWENWLRKLFRYGSNNKFVFASSIVISAISSFARGKLQMVPSDKTYGINITKYISPHGTVNLIEHKLFEGDIYAGYAAGLDLKNLKYRFLANSDIQLKTNIQAPDADGWVDEYIAEVGLEISLEGTHAVMTGVTSSNV